MGRIARQYLETSFFHVMVQGINKEYIFKNERYINRYIQLIREEIPRDNLKIIAFCIMNNHAHFLINTQKIEFLSKYLQKLNSCYANYYNYMEERCGYVFRDRFKSQSINSKRYLMHCVKYIHENPLKANMVKIIQNYKYSSYNFYRKIANNNEAYGPFSIEEIQFICNDNTQSIGDFVDVDNNIEESINSIITDFVYKENIKLFEIFENSDILKKLIKYLKISNNIKYTDIMKYLDITKGTMERLKR